MDEALARIRAYPVIGGPDGDARMRRHHIIPVQRVTSPSLALIMGDDRLIAVNSCEEKRRMAFEVCLLIHSDTAVSDVDALMLSAQSALEPAAGAYSNGVRLQPLELVRRPKPEPGDVDVLELSMIFSIEYECMRWRMDQGPE
jgi:hypothetical protein